MERLIAGIVLPGIAQAGGSTFSGLRSNRDDPPDVLFEEHGLRRGMEITELLPRNRLERDAVIRELKERILGSLDIGPRTRNQVVTVTLEGDYDVKLKLPGKGKALVAAISEFFQADLGPPERSSRASVALSAGLQGVVKRVSVQRWDLRGDPRISHPDEPLVIFSAQNTHVVPDVDFPAVVEERMREKLMTRYPCPTWLVVWSVHYAFAPFEKDLIRHLDTYVQNYEWPFERMFYLHLALEPHLTEFFRE